MASLCTRKIATLLYLKRIFKLENATFALHLEGRPSKTAISL